jgi:hypothetical protein
VLNGRKHPSSFAEHVEYFPELLRELPLAFVRCVLGVQGLSWTHYLEAGDDIYGESRFTPIKKKERTLASCIVRADAIAKKDCCQVCVPILLVTANVHRYGLTECMVETLDNAVSLRMVGSCVSLCLGDRILIEPERKES